MESQLIITTLLLLIGKALTQTVIDQGMGFGTYYYDIDSVEACGDDFRNQNQGFVECSFMTPLSLSDIGTNYIVAMNHTKLARNLAKYCGKKVSITVNGVKSNLPLFIGDGCERCGGNSTSNTYEWNPQNAAGLDFSYSVLSELSPQACFAGHIDISWEILDENLYNFDTNSPIEPSRRHIYDHPD